MVCLQINKCFLTVGFDLVLQQWWDVVIKSNDYPSFLSFIPKVLLAVIIPVLDTGYNEIAVWLNDMGECTKIAGGRMIHTLSSTWKVTLET